MITKSTDLLAKLLAKENISIAHAKARTASFNIKTRVLTIPNWKDMTPEVLDVMVFHEVGHALWTTPDYTEFLMLDGNAKYCNVMNVIEDSRIERMIKEQFPGVRKMFTEGYKQLSDKDFFGVNKSLYNTMGFIDRINLYYKIGAVSEITFSADEKPIIDQINRIKSISDVIEISKIVYDYCKLEKETKTVQFDDWQKEHAAEKQQEEDDEFENGSEEDQDDLEYSDEIESDMPNDETDEESNDEQGAGSGVIDPDNEDEIESQTQQNLHRMLEDLADDSTEFQYWKFDSMRYDPMVPFEDVIQTVGNYFQQEEYLNAIDADRAKKFMAETMPVVNYLVKEFELKKSADIYSRTKQAKSGDVDLKKLYAYKLKDDIFRKINVIPVGKNHGMIMLLDWSGSMTNHITDTLKQVINLVMFCRRAQIPFQVLAFTDVPHSQGHKLWYDFKKKNGYEPPSDKFSISKFSLLELFSDKMTAKQTNTMVQYCLSSKLPYVYRLNGTPLIESTAYMIDYIKQFQAARNIQKMTFITLTDGEGTSLNNGNIVERDWIDGALVNKKNFLVSENSKKNINLGKHFNSQMKATLELLKLETDSTVLGFFIGATNRWALAGFVNANMVFSGKHVEQRMIIETIVDITKKQIRDKSFATFTDTGRDALFFIPEKNTKITQEELVVDSNKSSRAIAGMLSKHLNKQKTSRVLLSNFIDYIA